MITLNVIEELVLSHVSELVDALLPGVSGLQRVVYIVKPGADFINKF